MTPAGDRNQHAAAIAHDREFVRREEELDAHEAREPWQWGNFLSRAEYDKCEELCALLEGGHASYNKWWRMIGKSVGRNVHAQYRIVRRRMAGEPPRCPQTGEERNIDGEAVDAARREFRDSIGPLCRGGDDDA